MLQATEPSNEQKLMKAIQTAMLDAHLHRVEAEVAMQIKTLFGRCPELAGFGFRIGPRFEIWPSGLTIATDLTRNPG